MADGPEEAACPFPAWPRSRWEGADAPDVVVDWPREWAPARAIVVHHTSARSTGLAPIDAVRDIHRLHAVDRGWGDIGYHVLIDPVGDVWLGRWGLRPVADGYEAVVAGHAYGHNRGSIGIALVGDYARTTVPDVAERSLRMVVARLCAVLGLAPGDPAAAICAGGDGAHRVLSTHGQCRDTPCPGPAVTELVEDLRVTTPVG